MTCVCVCVQDTEEAGWSRVGELAAAGACPCWCASWAEVHVRSPTGDVCWVMRMQNTMSWDYLLDEPLQDVAALLAPAPAADCGLAAARACVAAGAEPRPRSGSSSSQTRPAPLHSQDLHKSR